MKTMTTMMSGALALALLGSAAQAQPDQNRQDRPQHQRSVPSGQRAPQQRGPYPGAAPQSRPGWQGSRAGQGAPNYGRGQRAYGQSSFGQHPYAQAPYRRQPAYRQPSYGQDAYRRQRQGFVGGERQRYDPNRWQHSYYAQRRFRWEDRDHPGGWYYRRWTFGEYLPFGWFAPNFYLDAAQFDLPYAPYGCEWVREGPDAVLVDLQTGEVLSVDYGVFY